MARSLHLNRAELLIQQARFDSAIQELQEDIAQNPDHGYAFALLSVCQTRLKRRSEALTSAKRAIGLDPDCAYAHYALAHALDDRERHKQAEKAVLEAIRLSPENADYYAQLSITRFNQGKWRDSLAAAEMGLKLNAEHPDCANLRARSLVKLNMPDQARAGMSESLAVDPENAYSHAHQGWALLEIGDTRGAQEHFRIALRIDPTMEWAREGMLTALRARNPIYRLLINYSFFLSRLPAPSRIGVAAAVVIVPRLLASLADQNPALRVIAIPIVVLYFAFVYVTWTSEPLFNLLLRLDPFGRAILTRRQISKTNWIAANLALTALGIIGWLVSHWWWFILIAVGNGAITIPMAIIKPHKRSEHPLLILALGIAIICIFTFLAVVIFGTH